MTADPATLVPTARPRDRRAYFRAYDAARRIRRQAYDRGVRTSDREKARLEDAVRNANKTAEHLGVSGRIRYVDVEHLPPACVYCGSTDRLTIDHATPMSRGGENHWSNLTTACLGCNLRKRTRTVAEFRVIPILPTYGCRPDRPIRDRRPTRLQHDAREGAAR